MHPYHSRMDQNWTGPTLPPAPPDDPWAAPGRPSWSPGQATTDPWATPGAPSPFAPTMLTPQPEATAKALKTFLAKHYGKGGGKGSGKGGKGKK